jgi:PAS domain S-box-containing protein
MLPDYRTRQRDYLLEITRAMTQELDLEKLLQRILRLSVDILAGQAGLIALLAEDGSWSIAAAYGISPSVLEHLEPLLTDVSRAEEKTDTEGGTDEENPNQFGTPEVNRLMQTLTQVARTNLLSGVALPLSRRDEQVIGLIFVFRAYRGRFSNNDRNLLQSFANQAAIAVQNAQLYTQVRREKQRLDALLDSAADGILIMTPDHKIERCNPAFCRLWGQKMEEIQGLAHEDIIRWAGLSQGSTLEEAEMGGWPLTAYATLYVEGDLIRPSGVPIAVGITYAPLLSGDGNLLNIIAMVRDITHFREAEELKSVFISVISHELKTPVALIKGYVGTLRRDDANWERDVIQDSLEVIEEEADRLTELIENLLDASRLQAGGIKLNLTDIALENFSDRLAARFRTQSEKHAILVDFPPNFPIVLGDEERLGQVLSNLLSNAIKYSPAGGEIRIIGQVHPEQIIVCVQDQGPGIAPGDIPHIFDRFYRADSASRTTKGAGLGLYLTRAVIEAHNGRIWVDPRPDGGARICFSLPR